MNPKLILVTGATGYIASRLIPRLLEAGYRVRALARDPRRLAERKWSSGVEMVSGDVASPHTLIAALDGIHTAYYLIHNMLSGRGYTSRELDSAHNFASAAEKAGIQHIIYLGGLADPNQDIAPHMRSRIETGEVLREGKTPVTEFRAGVIVGPGSISFEMIRFMTEQFPILPGPRWLKNKSQPIATQNVLDYLMAVLDTSNGQDKIFEIGGPDIKDYSDLMLTYARQRGLRRWLFTLPGIPIWFMAWWVNKLAPIPLPIAYALIGGLQSDSLVHDGAARRIFPSVQLISYEEATTIALAQLHPDRLERIWAGESHLETQLKHEGFFIDHRSILTDASPNQVISKIKTLAQKYFSIFIIEDSSPGRILLRSEKFGARWMEWRLEPNSKRLAVSQTFFFAPRGLPGFLRWYLCNPLRRIILRGLIQAVERQSKNP